MKLIVIFLFAMYACGNCMVNRIDYMGNYEKIVRVYTFIMSHAEKVHEERSSMYFSMLVNALLDIGRKYYSTPKQFDTTYLPITVGSMNEVRNHPDKYIMKQKKHFSAIYTKYIKLISDLIEKLCKPEDMPNCNKLIDDYINKLSKEKHSDYHTASLILVKVSHIANVFVESSTSVWNLAAKDQPLVRFLANPKKSLPVVTDIAEVYKISHGPMRMMQQ